MILKSQFVKDDSVYYIGITGPRPANLNNDYTYLSPLMSWISSMIYRTITDIEEQAGKRVVLITGMALGVDTIAAKLCILGGYEFIGALPCLNQEKTWKPDQVRLYRQLISDPLCNAILINNSPYYKECMKDRNIWIGDICDTLISVWDGKTEGGTSQCTRYVQNLDKPIHYINPKNFKQ